MALVPQPLSRQALGELTRNIGAAPDVRALAALSARHAGSFDALHHAALCGAAAKAPGGAPGGRALALGLFAQHARAWLACPRGSFGREGRAAANILYSAARLRLEDGGLVRDLAEEAARLAPTFIAQNASNSLWALATLGVADDALVRPIAFTAARLAPTLKTQEAANSLWALATLGVADDALVRPIAATAVRLAPMFNAQDAANSL